MFLPKFNEDLAIDGYVKIPSGEYEGLLCKPSYLTLSQSEKEKICNGIGAATGLSKHFPNTVWGLSIEECGNIHDYDYFIGGTKEDKDNADLVLLHNSRLLIKRASFLLRYVRNLRVNKYYVAVQLGGNSHFNFIK